MYMIPCNRYVCPGFYAAVHPRAVFTYLSCVTAGPSVPSVTTSGCVTPPVLILTVAVRLGLRLSHCLRCPPAPAAQVPGRFVVRDDTAQPVLSRVSGSSPHEVVRSDRTDSHGFPQHADLGPEPQPVDCHPPGSIFALIQSP